MPKRKNNLKIWLLLQKQIALKLEDPKSTISDIRSLIQKQLEVFDEFSEIETQAFANLKLI